MWISVRVIMMTFASFSTQVKTKQQQQQNPKETVNAYCGRWMHAIWINALLWCAQQLPTHPT